MLPLEAIEANRRSYEHLVEAEEVLQELASSALAQDEKSFGYTKQQPMSLVVSKMGTRVELHSLAPLVAFMQLATWPTSSQQVFFLSQLGKEFIRFHPKPPDYGGSK